jgi:hypothetical protein
MNVDLGFKVLVYPATDPPEPSVSPCVCSFVFKCDTAKRATLLLFTSIPTIHDAETPFVLQYDADMLERSTLVSNSGSVTRSQIDTMVREERGKGKGKRRLDIKTLHLTTMDVPPLWCAAAIPSFSPQPGNEPAFQQFSHLAKARYIHIVLDVPGIHGKHQSMFRAFSKRARNLEGFPVRDLLIEKGLRKASWEVFAPSEIAPSETIGVPPAYSREGQAEGESEGEGSRTRKRSRPGKLLDDPINSTSTDPRREPQQSHPAVTALHSSVCRRCALGPQARALGPRARAPGSGGRCCRRAGAPGHGPHGPPTLIPVALV